jgi:hypothetical protein
MRYSRVIIRQQCAALLRFVDAVLEARRPCLVSVGGNWIVGSDPQGSAARVCFVNMYLEVSGISLLFAESDWKLIDVQN